MEDSFELKERELKPCPFCGGKAVIADTIDFDAYYVRCRDCLARTIDSGRMMAAVKAWNRRPEIRNENKECAIIGIGKRMINLRTGGKEK